MSIRATAAIFFIELTRSGSYQSIVSPILTSGLYVLLLGPALSAQMAARQDVSYEQFIVPGLVMLLIMPQSVMSASFGVYYSRFTGSMAELVGAPISKLHIATGFIGAAIIKSVTIVLAIIILSLTTIPITIVHPIYLLAVIFGFILVFSSLGFAIGLLASDFEVLQIVPVLVLTPLIFLGGALYSIEYLPSAWLVWVDWNPFTYFVHLLRWAFFGHPDVGASGVVSVMGCILIMAVVTYIIRTRPFV